MHQLTQSMHFLPRIWVYHWCQGNLRDQDTCSLYTGVFTNAGNWTPVNHWIEGASRANLLGSGLTFIFKSYRRIIQKHNGIYLKDILDSFAWQWTIVLCQIRTRLQPTGMKHPCVSIILLSKSGWASAACVWIFAPSSHGSFYLEVNKLSATPSKSVCKVTEIFLVRTVVVND